MRENVNWLDTPLSGAPVSSAASVRGCIVTGQRGIKHTLLYVAGVRYPFARPEIP